MIPNHEKLSVEAHMLLYFLIYVSGHHPALFISIINLINGTKLLQA